MESVTISKKQLIETFAKANAIALKELFEDFEIDMEDQFEMMELLTFYAALLEHRVEALIYA